MHIHFQIEYKTHWGENIFLCLNIDGNTCQLIELNNNGSGLWFTDYRLDSHIISSQEISYYYTVMVDGCITRREEGMLHTIPHIETQRLVLFDRWREEKEYNIEQRSLAIPHVKHTVSPLWKGAGTAIPVFSLRSASDWGIGEFTDLKHIVDWAAATGQSVIQTLPVNDTTITGTWRDSYPYSANSSFALNPIYINLEVVGELSDKSYTRQMESLRQELNSLETIDFERVQRVKSDYLDRLYAEHGESCMESATFRSFFNENRSWLEPYALYCYFRDQYGTPCFDRWQESEYSPELLVLFCSPTSPSYKDICKHYFVQYHLHLQLLDVKRYANSKGILLKGDIPIGVNRHSADVWIHPKLFHTDCQAGAPPDAFATDGQRWGMPTYNWENMAKDGYAWFIARFRNMAHYFDAYRIDHLLGFFRIWEVPMQYSSGLMGRFNPALTYTPQEIFDKGFPFNQALHAAAPTGTPETNVLFLEDRHQPGTYHPRINGFNTPMFNALPEREQVAFRCLHDDFYYRRNTQFWSKSALAKLPSLIEATDMLVCGEDLGMIPDCVPELMERLRILSLEVQRMPKQMGVAVSDPASYQYMSVCTTSTHDMSVLREWIEREMDANPIISASHATTAICARVIQSHLESASMLAIFPLQDWLSINEELRAKNPQDERINVPSDPNNYWRYRMHITLEELIAATALNQQIKSLITSSNR